MSEHFKTVTGISTGFYDEKGSRFIGICQPMNEDDEIVSRLKEAKGLYPRARHYCYAYRLGSSGNRFRINDDGEPSGTAGRPILNQVDAFEVTNVLVIVVRYFGGTLLGTGGLIHAYKNASKASLENARIINLTLEYPLIVRCSYLALPELMNTVKILNIKIESQSFDSNCILHLSATRAQIDKITAIRFSSNEIQFSCD